MARTITDRKLVNTASGGAGAEDTGTGLPVMADGRVLTDVELYGDPKSSYANHVIFKTSGTWTVPDGVTSLRVTCMGGCGSEAKKINSRFIAYGGGSASCLNITANAGENVLLQDNNVKNYFGGQGGMGSGGIINGRGGNGGNGAMLSKDSSSTSLSSTELPKPGNPGTNRAPAGGPGKLIYKSETQSEGPTKTYGGGGGGGYAMGYVTVRPGQDVPYTVNGFGNPYVMIEY